MFVEGPDGNRLRGVSPIKYFVELEIRGALERELKTDTIEGCLLVEQLVRDGFLRYPSVVGDTFLTVRAMEHVTVPTGRVP